MNPLNHWRPKSGSLQTGDVIRYRSGKSALMRITGMDELTGFRRYKGIHLYGEPIEVSADGCRHVNTEEHKLWWAYGKQREQ